MTQRVYIPFMLFNMRIVNMQYLWNPSLEYLGKKTEKPNYFVTAITPKTRAGWWEEPLLGAAWAAYDQLLQRSGMTPQHVSEWPIKDGDLPPEPGKAPSEWAKGHWILGGSSSSQIKAEIVQGSNCIPLPAKVGVKPGDFVALGVSAAIKQNNPRALKHFCNTVLFTGAGEEIAVGNSVSGAELMRMAEQQGLRPAGFQASPGFAGGAPGGFAGPGAAGPGFTPPGPGGVPGNPVGGAFPGATAPSGPGFTGSAAFPSNGAPGFTAPQPGNFAPSGPGGAPMGAQYTGPSGPGSFPPR